MAATSKASSLFFLSLACVSFPTNRASCDRIDVPSSPTYRQAHRAVTHVLGKVVAAHVNKILKAGYAEEISDIDLFHGHLFWKNTSQRQAYKLLSRGDISQVPLVLYHTAEHIHRWDMIEKDLPLAQKTPRTIIGYPDGRIAPIGDVFSEEILKKQKNYVSFGTVHDHAIPELIPGVIQGPQFYIHLDRFGRFRAKDSRFDVFLKRDERVFWKPSQFSLKR